MQWFQRVGKIWERAVAVGCLVALACGGDELSIFDRTPKDDAYEFVGAELPCPSSIEEFRVGSAGLSSRDVDTGTTVRIEDASAVPPSGRQNDWDVVITSADGTLLDDAQITWACAWMPSRGLGSRPRRIEQVGPGRFRLGQQNLSMPGPWEVRLWIDLDGESDEQTPSGNSSAARDVCWPNDSDSTVMVAFDVCVPSSRIAE